MPDPEPACGDEQIVYETCLDTRCTTEATARAACSLASDAAVTCDTLPDCCCNACDELRKELADCLGCDDDAASSPCGVGGGDDPGDKDDPTDIEIVRSINQAAAVTAQPSWGLLLLLISLGALAQFEWRA